MDKKTKIVIIVLVVFAALFFSGVAGNLVHKKRAGTDEGSYEQGGWETTLGKWMAPFAPSLDVGKLLSKNSNTCKSTTYKYLYKVILLNKTEDTCVIDIPKLKKEKYSKGKLSLIRDGSVPNVTVQYVPAGEKDDDYKAKSFKPDKLGEPVKEFSFVVLKKGGKLTVKCEGCFKQQERTIQIKFE